MEPNLIDLWAAGAVVTPAGSFTPVAAAGAGAATAGAAGFSWTTAAPLTGGAGGVARAMLAQLFLGGAVNFGNEEE